MVHGLNVTWWSLRDWLRHLPILLLATLAWAVLSLTVVLLPPATAALYVVTNRIAYGQPLHHADFTGALRRYAGVSWRWAAANALIGVPAYFAVLDDRTAPHLPDALKTAAALAALTWALLQFYVWPCLLEQDDKRLRSALRSAALLAVAAPFYSLTVLGLSLALLIVSIVLRFPLLVTVSFLALLGNHAVLDRLNAYGRAPNPTAAVPD